MKGFYFNDWKSYNAPPQQWGLYQPPLTDQSLQNLASTGTNWIAVMVSAHQETIESTTIFHTQPSTATNSEVRRVVDLAHSLGMRVLLMPALHLSNDPTHWHGQIGTAFTSEAQWQQWFAAYQEHINYYAAFAQEAGVDMLFIGNELGGVTHREDDWRRIIKEVRDKFKGPITYDSLVDGTFPFGERQRIKWWDALDYIGVCGYKPLTKKNDPTIAELKEAWMKSGYLADLEEFSKQFNRPIIISEIGYVSADGTNTEPANMQKFANAASDPQEQADCYQAALEVFWGKPWLKGIFWHQWSAKGLIWPESPQSKPAEEVLKKFYLSP